MIHELKTCPEPFGEIVAGTKTFEYRRNDDRHFRQGDLLVLKEWDPATRQYTGNEVTARVGLVICGYDGETFGIPKDYAVLSITRLWSSDGIAGWAVTPVLAAGEPDPESAEVGRPDLSGGDLHTTGFHARQWEYAEEGGARP